MQRLALALPAAILLAGLSIARIQPIQTSPISFPGCVGAVTATGQPAVCQVFGNADPSANDAQLVATGVPPNQFTLFITGLAQVPPDTVHAGNGYICIHPQTGLGRFQGPQQIKNSGPLGEVTLDSTAGDWNVGAIPTSVGTTYSAVAGTTTYFQAWFREPVGAGFNFSGSAVMLWQ